MQLDAFPASLHKPLNALGFDHGSRRIGVAFGQSLTGTARALPILNARDGIPDWQQLESLITTWRPDVLVVGLPLHTDDANNPSLAAAQRFAGRLHGRFGLPCYGIDESLSSHAAEALPGAKKNLDSLAALLILESWLTELQTRFTD